MRNLTRSKLPVLDEVGYLQFDPVQASLLFQVICQRYQRQQAIVLTSNKAFSDWSQVFADDPVMASAALDRPLHRSTVINIRSDSYRLREKRQAGAEPASGVPKWGQLRPTQTKKLLTRHVTVLNCTL